MTDRELMQQALDALEQIRDAKVQRLELLPVYHETIEALRDQLAQPEPEPVAVIQQLWGIIDDIDTYSDVAKTDDKLYRSLVERKQKDRWKTGITTDGYTLNVPLYTAPPQREWQGLTDEEIVGTDALGIYAKPLIEFARAIETKLKGKNAI